MKTILYKLVIILIVFTSCEQKQEKKEIVKKENSKEVTVKIEAEDFTSLSEKFEVEILDSQTKVINTTAAGWVAFDAKIPAAGRYKTEVKFAQDSVVTVWIEDYVDNKDERTYNITGNMVGKGEGFNVNGVDGSPLNEGVHKMKVHFNSPLKIDWIKFTLLKKHVFTPTSLKQNTEGKDWKVVWADEFDGPEIDSTKWTYDFGNWGWGNFEMQYYTDKRKENARIEDGNLIIEARKNDMGEKWTSARLTTRGKTSFTYGRIEFRAKVPVEKGNWAAGWTLGDSYIDELSWPYCGEIDILESVGYELDNETGNGLAHASVHCEAYYFKIGNQKTFTVEVEKMNTEYHLYAVEWTPEKITGFVDDQEYFFYENTNKKEAWPFDEPQNIILNLAMGGGWGGAQGMDETMTSQKMIIDYVRVYEKK